MALDGFFLSSLKENLKELLIGRKVEKITQPEKDEIILHFKINRKSRGLLISASSNYPRIHFTDVKRENPAKPPMFCMVLRKYLKGSIILDIEQLGTDRLFKIKFKATDELGFESNFFLIIEIMGRHSNISLVREKDGIIMDCVKHITPAKNSFRSVMSGLKYVYPPASTSLNPYDFNTEALRNNIEFLDNFNDKVFCRLFTGVGPEVSREILYRMGDHIESLDSLADESHRIKSIMNELIQSNNHYATYSLNGNLQCFHCIELTHLMSKGYDANMIESPSELLESFYYKKDLQDRMHNKTSDIQRLVSNNIERCEKKIKIMQNTLKDSHKKDKFKLYGELLTSYIYGITPGDEKVSVLNYYVTDKEEYIDIPLDPNKSPSDNIQKYYKRYNKMKKSEEMASIQLKTASEELEYLNSIFVSIANCTSVSEINEIKKELIESGYLKKKKSKKKEKEGKSAPLHFKSTDGVDIYVGKNNLQNDYLTLKFASKNDIWMHTKEIPGSHVIVKNNGELSEATLAEAANLAAYYSKAKNATKVPVDYTEVKHVKKPSGSKPGMVIYYTNKTFFIDPEEPSLDKVE